MVSPESSEPVVLGDMFPALFGNTQLTNGRHYVFYAYDPETNTYSSPLDANTLIESGQGIWANQRTGATVVSDYVGTPLSGTMDLTLKPGWNMVGVPSTEPSDPVYIALPSGGGACTNSPCTFFQMRVFGYSRAPIYALREVDGVRKYVDVSDIEHQPGEARWIYAGDRPGLTERHAGGE